MICQVMREHGKDKSSYHNAVVPCEYSKIVEASHQIPPRSDVAGYEDRKSEDREGVHEFLPIAGTSPTLKNG